MKQRHRLHQPGALALEAFAPQSSTGFALWVFVSTLGSLALIGMGTRAIMASSSLSPPLITIGRMSLEQAFGSAVGFAVASAVCATSLVTVSQGAAILTFTRGRRHWAWPLSFVWIPLVCASPAIVSVAYATRKASALLLEF